MAHWYKKLTVDKIRSVTLGSATYVWHFKNKTENDPLSQSELFAWLICHSSKKCIIKSLNAIYLEPEASEINITDKAFFLLKSL